MNMLKKDLFKGYLGDRFSVSEIITNADSEGTWRIKIRVGDNEGKATERIHSKVFDDRPTDEQVDKVYGELIKLYVRAAFLCIETSTIMNRIKIDN